MKNNSKRRLALLLAALILALQASGCGQRSEGTDPKTAPAAPTAAPTATSQAEPQPEVTEAPHEETYDRLTGQVWIATRDDAHGYMIEFWPDGVCYIIRTYGENWTGAARLSYHIASETGQPVIGDGFPVMMARDGQTMDLVLPNEGSWSFKLSDHSLSAINEHLSDYEAIFTGVESAQAGSAAAPAGNTVSEGREVQTGADGRIHYSVADGRFEFDSDINIWDYIDESNCFDLVRMLEDWEFGSISIKPGNSCIAQSSSRRMSLDFQLANRDPLNSYQLQTAVYWELNWSTRVSIGPRTAAEARYAVKDSSPWGMALDEIALLAYCVQYGSDDTSDPYYTPNIRTILGGSSNQFWLP